MFIHPFSSVYLVPTVYQKLGSGLSMMSKVRGMLDVPRVCFSYVSQSLRALTTWSTGTSIQEGVPWRFDKTTSLKIQELRMVASSGLSIGVNWVGTDEFPGFKFWSKLCAFQQVTSPLCASFYSWVKWRQ